MKRRDFLTSGTALAGVTLIGAPSPVMARRVPAWPNATAWDALARMLAGRLAPVIMPDVTDPTIVKLMENPFYVSGQPGLTQSSGWLDAWRSKVAPDAGTYVNECDFHQENWRQAFWGIHAPRLEAIKRRYDPGRLFTVHHGIGSA